MGAFQRTEILDDLLPIVRERPKNRIMAQLIGELGYALPITRDRHAVAPGQLVQAADQGIPDLCWRLIPVDLCLDFGRLGGEIVPQSLGRGFADEA